MQVRDGRVYLKVALKKENDACNIVDIVAVFVSQGFSPIQRPAPHAVAFLPAAAQGAPNADSHRLLHRRHISHSGMEHFISHELTLSPSKYTY
jgi:hypothetical protein